MKYVFKHKEITGCINCPFRTSRHRPYHTEYTCGLVHKSLVGGLVKDLVPRPGCILEDE